MFLHAPPLTSLLISFLALLSPGSGLTSDPVAVQPFRVKSSPPPATTTIPAFPEQSDLSGCPLDLSDDNLFHSVHSACGSRDLRRERCCPVLGAWLYAAYSSAALGRRRTVGKNSSSSSELLPVPPDDSETCAEVLEKAMRRRGMGMTWPNDTCDVVSCFCGIRLHPLTCPAAFHVSTEDDDDGKLVGDGNVDRLEKDCLGDCNNCLNTLYKLNPKKKQPSSSSGTTSSSKPSKEDESRTAEMQNKDCELMGLTWLLATNRTAYIHTVTSVLRAILLNGGSDRSIGPRSCTLSSDGLPLAVDSSEFSSSSLSLSPLFPSYALFILSGITLVLL